MMVQEKQLQDKSLHGLMAREVMTDRYKLVEPTLTLSAAVNLFDDDTDVLFIKQDGRLAILTLRMIVRSGLKRRARVEDLMSYAPKVTPDEPLVECARLMIENDVYQLPVVEATAEPGERPTTEEAHLRIIGVVTADALLARVARELFGDRPAREVVTSEALVCSPEDSLFAVASLFRNHHVERLPVVSDGRLVGVVTMHDLVEAAQRMDTSPDIFATMNEKHSLYQLPVENIMTHTVETARPETRVGELISLMLDRGVGGIVIVDENKLPLGMVSKRDLLEQVMAAAPRQVPVVVRISAKGLDREGLQSAADAFITAHERELGEGSLSLYLRRVSAKKPIVLCTARLLTTTVRVRATGEGKTPLEALNDCLTTMKELVRKERSRRSH